MIKVNKKPAGPDYENWQIRAKLARQQLLNEWQAHLAKESSEEFDWQARFKKCLNVKIYKELRTLFLIPAFSGKCAYCEHANGSHYPVHTEHFRPKGLVTEGRSPIKHNGYFWLVYEWWNLLPSCASCNTNHTDPADKVSHPGKLNEFPISGDRVCHPCSDPDGWVAALDPEVPLLLNPYFDDPEAHIEFDWLTGLPIPRNESPRGRETIKVCHLDRMSLCEERLEKARLICIGIINEALVKDTPVDVPHSLEFSAFVKIYTVKKMLSLLPAKTD